ncbi:MAG: T9SS type A sorting domain-containing protein, partial [Ignavibacteriales bacterium]
MRTLKISLLVFILSITISAQWEWENIGLAGSYIYDIEIDNNGNIYVAANGLYKSSDNGLSWQFINIGAIGIEIDENGIIYVISGGPGQVFKSTDGGNTFIQIAQSIPTDGFYDIEIIPAGILFLSSFIGIYKSFDEGVTWFPTGFTGFGAMDIGINTNGKMFFANSTLSWMGIYRSSDFGNTWQLTPPGYYCTALEYLNDGSVLAGCRENVVTDGGIYISTDDGYSWENTNSFNANNLDFRDIELDRNQDLYVSLTSSNPNQRGVYLSTNNGYFWTYVGLSNISQITCLAIDSIGYVYAGCYFEGIFRAPGITVPVELFSFTAIANNNGVILNWSTATETNNSGFEILRSTKEDGWNKIGFVPGHGTTTETQHYSFTDNNVSSGKYQYKLKQIDYDGTFEYSQIVEVEIPFVNEFSLSQNFPNPFNPVTKIKYSIPSVRTQRAVSVQLIVYDVLGREIAILVNEEKPAGEYEVEFDAANLLPKGSLTSGIYFYQLKAGELTETRKMVLIK